MKTNMFFSIANRLVQRKIPKECIFFRT